MRGWMGRSLAVAGFGALALAGCAAPPQAPVAAAPPPAPAGPPPPSGAIAGPLGASLSDADRQIASDAQYNAVDSGQRKSWRGKGTAFGFIEPGPENANCRDYTDTVFIDGRSQVGKGRACRLPNGGGWKM